MGAYRVRWHIGEISVNPYDPDVVFVSVLGHFWSKNKNRVFIELWMEVYPGIMF